MIPINKIQLLFTLIFAFITTICVGQVKIIDSISGLPIAAVNVFSKNGDLVGISDTSGFVHNEAFFNDTKKLDYTLSFQHISYNNIETSVANVKLNWVVRLPPRSIALKEVSISNKGTEHTQLTAYFQVYQSYQTQPKYFVDGIVDYYISKKTGEIKLSVKEYRVFENQNLIEKYKLKSGLINEPPKTIRISNRELLAGLEKDYHLIKDGKNCEIFKQNAKVGYIKKTL